METKKSNLLGKVVWAVAFGAPGQLPHLQL